MRTNWIKSERKLLIGTDGKGKQTIRKGKNGGPVVNQDVTKVMIPKGAG